MFCFFFLALKYPSLIPDSQSVYDKGLVKTSLKPKEILDNYERYLDPPHSRFKNANGKPHQVLAFVTPWNSDGYNLSLTFGAKFTIIVPIWFQLGFTDDGQLSIKGHDAINAEWLKEMKMKHPKIIIAPRILFELPQEFLIAKKNQVFKLLSSSVGSLFKDYKFGGLFIEFPNILINYESAKILPKVLQTIRKAMPRHSQLIIDVLTYHKVNYNNEHMKVIQQIVNVVDYILVSAYEVYSDPTLSQSSIIMDIIKWVNIQKMAQKTIIGLPFFGFDYFNGNRNYIFGDDIAQVLANNKVYVKYITSYGEHTMHYSRDGVNHNMFYPTPLFLDNRIETIIDNDIPGIGFWEMAQGMPYLFDVL